MAGKKKNVKRAKSVDLGDPEVRRFIEAVSWELVDNDVDRLSSMPVAMTIVGAVRKALAASDFAEGINAIQEERRRRLEFWRSNHAESERFKRLEENFEKSKDL